MGKTGHMHPKICVCYRVHLNDVPVQLKDKCHRCKKVSLELCKMFFSSADGNSNMMHIDNLNLGVVITSYISITDVDRCPHADSTLIGIHFCVYTVGTLTSGFKLVVLFGLEDRMGDPQPGVMLPQLGDQVVGHKPHRPRQSVQHDGDKGLEKQVGVAKETLDHYPGKRSKKSVGVRRNS